MLGFLFYADTQVRVRSCLSNNNFIRNSGVERAKIVVDAGTGNSQRHDRLRACSLARTRDSPGYGTMPLHACPSPSSAIAPPGPCGCGRGEFRKPPCLCVLAVALLTALSAAVRLLCFGLLLCLCLRLLCAGFCHCALLLTIREGHTN